MATATVNTTTTIQEAQDQYIKDLLASAQGVVGANNRLPDYTDYIANLSPDQQSAMQLARDSVGNYAPMMQAGADAMTGGLGSYGEAMDLTRMGSAALRGTGGIYDPSMYMAYMDPYLNDVIRQSENDIRRNTDIERNTQNANAVSAGAFGGSRAAIADQELQRNSADTMSRMGSTMRHQGWNTAQQMAQNAFENSNNRAQSAAQLFGGLAQGAGSIGQGIGALGSDMAGLGEASQIAGQRDVNTLLGIGSLEQSQEQAQLTGQLNNYEQARTQPYQDVAFLSDIYRGVPSSQNTITSTTTADPSLISQLTGSALTYQALKNGGYFDYGATR